MDRNGHPVLTHGPSWRQVYLTILVLVLASATWILLLLHRGQGTDAALLAANARSVALEDSIARSVALGREAVAEQDTLQRALHGSVRLVVRQMEHMARDDREFQRRYFRALDARVRRIEARADTIQDVLPRPKHRRK